MFFAQALHGLLFRQWDLLRNAVNIASTKQYFATLHTDNGALRKDFLQNLDSIGVAFCVPQLRDYNRIVGD